MKKHIIIAIIIGITYQIPTPTYAQMTEVTPSLTDFTYMSYATNFSCAKDGNTCYYCGSTSQCPTGCSNYTQVQTGKYQMIGESAIGCLGSSFCIAPSNGILTFKDGVTTNTEYKFYGYETFPANHCRRRYGLLSCTEWATTATTMTVAGKSLPFCRCTAATSSSINNYKCDICDQGYYLSDTKCEQCPSASDIYTDANLTTTAPGTTISIGATAITSCYITSGTYFDSTGAFSLTGNCYNN